MRRLQSLVLACTILLVSATFAAAALLDIAPAGGGRFSINGTAMDGVAGIDLNITYDTATLANPVISQGSLVAGAMMAANASSPGTIKLAIISTKAFAGSGQIAAITFTAPTGGEGLTAFSAKLIDLKGAAIPATVTIDGKITSAQPASPGFSLTAGVPFSNPGSAGQEQHQISRNRATAPGAAAATTQSTTATAVTSSIGTLTLSGDATAPPQQQKAEEIPPAEYQQEVRAEQPSSEVVNRDEYLLAGKSAVAATAKSTEIISVRYAGIVERFRGFNGERTLASFRGLFAQPLAETVRQEPPIAVISESAIVKIFVTSSAVGLATLPTVATNGAKLLSLKADKTARYWELELLPRSAAIDASVSILAEQRIIEIPLVLIPPAGIPLTFSESEITAFMKDSGVKKPLFDLNRDGKHDYLDDYMYTGYYLLNKKPREK